MSEGVIRAWRLSKARYAGDLTGQGAARDGQRWNQSGQRAVYLGLTPEITVLEVLVHLNGVLIAPLVLSAYEVPAGPGLISEAEPEALFGQAYNVGCGPTLMSLTSPRLRGDSHGSGHGQASRHPRRRA